MEGMIDFRACGTFRKDDVVKLTELIREDHVTKQSNQFMNHNMYVQLGSADVHEVILLFLL